MPCHSRKVTRSSLGEEATCQDAFFKLREAFGRQAILGNSYCPEQLLCGNSYWFGRNFSLWGAGGEILLLHLHGLCFAAGGAAAAAGTSASAAALAAGAAAGAATGAVFRPLIHGDVEVVDIFWGNKRFR